MTSSLQLKHFQRVCMFDFYLEILLLQLVKKLIWRLEIWLLG